MKKSIIYIFPLLILLVGGNACNKSSLSLSPVAAVTDDAVFSSSDGGLMTAFVNNIYEGIPDGFNWGMLASVTDEAHMNGGSWAGMTSIMLSQLTPSNLSSFANGSYYGMYSWAALYVKIRATNLFFAKIDASPVDTATKNALKGEVFFLRAYLYHDLVSLYGGVPLITKAYTLSDSFNVARSSYADCIQFVSDNCDSAAQYLPVTQSAVGRATRGAALALKSRALLYAASDLYNTPSVWSSYGHPELVSYTSASGSDRQARWQKAYDAAKAVMNLGVYSLYKPNPASAAEAKDNYYSLFVSMSTPEDIFCRYYTTNFTGAWTTFNPGLFHNPNGWHGWGTEAPTQQLVDEYEMNDGTKFSWVNSAQAAAPYQNREPRFYASILYDRAHWRTRPSDVSGDPAGLLQTGHWYSDATTLKDGLDNKGANGGIDNWNGGWTGYYMKKWIDSAIDPVAIKQTNPWRFIRYTEVLLNYAEACIGLGLEAEARTYINQIRTRAGLPDITTTGSDLVASLQHERKVELAFEELRYYDVRRWMIAESTFSDVMGVNIVYGSPSSTSPTYGTGTPTYSVIDVDARAWDHKMYFLPITIDEMNKNTQLVQNPFY